MNPGSEDGPFRTNPSIGLLGTRSRTETIVDMSNLQEGP